MLVVVVVAAVVVAAVDSMSSAQHLADDMVSSLEQLFFVPPFPSPLLCIAWPFLDP